MLSEQFGFQLNTEVSNGYTEIDLDALLEDLPLPDKYDDCEFPTEFIQHKPHSLYPFVLRDIAVWVPNDVITDVITSVITEKGGELLVRTDLFDTFEKDGRTSYAFHLVFQSHEKTLSDDEVNVIMKDIEDTLKEKAFEVR